MKKTLIILGAWAIAVILVATMVVSIGYSFSEAIFISVLYLPGVLAAHFSLPKVSFKSRIVDTIFIMLAILVVEILLMVFASLFIGHMRHLTIWIYDDYPNSLYNPVFVGMILALLIVGDNTLTRQLDKWFPSKLMPLRFISERKAVSLQRNEILYIESNDTEVMVYATEGRRFRSKTSISQWESVLGKDFLRIHRSYLVNSDLAVLISPDAVAVGSARLPVSRKYRKIVNYSLTNQITI